MSATYLKPLYARANTLKIWESSFEPYLDPTAMAKKYKGLEYVPDVDILKAKKREAKETAKR